MKRIVSSEVRDPSKIQRSRGWKQGGVKRKTTGLGVTEERSTSLPSRKYAEEKCRIPTKELCIFSGRKSTT